MKYLLLLSDLTQNKNGSTLIGQRPNVNSHRDPLSCSRGVIWALTEVRIHFTITLQFNDMAVLLLWALHAGD
jgi:hypothetical protein